MPEARLSRRLYAAFLLVEGGKRLADIGTDHALLPIALVKSGKVPSAVASDINPLPLEKARENIRREGLEARIETVLTDGARGLEGLAEEFVIAGMGGELIAEIITASPFLKSDKIHMVLQPMTKKAFLRSFLWNSGFEIKAEKHLEDSGHFYTLLSVSYTGEKAAVTTLEAEIGRAETRESLEREDALALISEIRLKMYDLTNKINGKQKAGASADDEKELFEALEKSLEELERKNYDS